MATRRNAYQLGSGDPCPLTVPGTEPHGKMLVLNGSTKQYCPHQSHDGRPKTHPLGAYPATRHFWPIQFFTREVELYRTLKAAAGEAVEFDLLGQLPDLDIDLPDFDIDLEV